MFKFDLSETHWKDYDKVLKAFEDYATPRWNVVVERYLFNSRCQEEGEHFDTYVTELNKLVLNCEFGDQMDSVLRDRNVLGIQDKNLHQSLWNRTYCRIK